MKLVTMLQAAALAVLMVFGAWAAGQDSRVDGADPDCALSLDACGLYASLRY
ncbi:hypothetical protein LVO79_07440 [Roseivivax marinus]|jgi:hypothetical protein|uniref:hypothetical protein n=1 Tax=Roseivivax marinus TaxID=1379903 RepID=UPI0004B27D62|nr:hypothetical protein [Roseivivax marinus]UMA66265.1 hypothetical protein LVO79_07440 [Roseivivax marinus]SEL33941.1 hypothetical protein SAMN05444413_10822 [Roseivivax marinus]